VELREQQKNEFISLVTVHKMCANQSGCVCDVCEDAVFSLSNAAVVVDLFQVHG